MGREVGFEFFWLIDNKLVPAEVATEDWDFDPRKTSYIFTCGRCKATDIFLRAVENKESPNAYKRDAKPEDKYSAYLLMNHPEFDGFEVHKREGDTGWDWYDDWFKKYFYYGFEDFKKLFDFEEAQKKHDDWLKDLDQEILDYQKEIESIRKHQEKAKTKVAFDGFEENIQKIKEYLLETQQSKKDIEEDDYDYLHYMSIKSHFEQVERIMKEDQSVVVAAFASD